MTKINLHILDSSFYPDESYNPKRTRDLKKGQETKQFKNSKKNICAFLDAHPNAKLAILYAANDLETKFLSDFNVAKNKSAVEVYIRDRGRQAVFVYQMVEWIKKLERSHPEYNSRIHILPFKTTIEFRCKPKTKRGMLKLQVPFADWDSSVVVLESYFEDSNVTVTGFVCKAPGEAQMLEFSLDGGGLCKDFTTSLLRYIDDVDVDVDVDDVDYGLKDFLRGMMSTDPYNLEETDEEADDFVKDMSYYERDVLPDESLIECILNRLTLNDLTQAMIMSMDVPAQKKKQTFLRELIRRVEIAEYLASVQKSENKTPKLNSEYDVSDDDNASPVSSNKYAMFKEKKVNEKELLMTNKEKKRSECGCNLV